MENGNVPQENADDPPREQEPPPAPQPAPAEPEAGEVAFLSPFSMPGEFGVQGLCFLLDGRVGARHHLCMGDAVGLILSCTGHWKVPHILHALLVLLTQVEKQL